MRRLRSPNPITSPPPPDRFRSPEGKDPSRRSKELSSTDSHKLSAHARRTHPHDPPVPPREKPRSPPRVFERFRTDFLLKRHLKPNPSTAKKPEAVENRRVTSTRCVPFDLGHVLELIFYHGYAFQDLRGAEAVLAQVPSLAHLMDAICERHIRPYMEAFESLVYSHMEAVTCVTRDSQRESSAVFLPFNKRVRAYSKLIELFHSQYDSLERVYVQVELLIKRFESAYDRGNEAASGLLHERLSQAWRFNSEAIYRLILHLKCYFEEKSKAISFGALEEKMNRVAKMYLALEKNENSNNYQRDSETPTYESRPNHLSGQKENFQIVVDSELLSPKVENSEGAKKKKKNKKKTKEKDGRKEKLEIDEKVLNFESICPLRSKIQVKFSPEEFESLNQHLANI